jgi:hypothetical protein
VEGSQNGLLSSQHSSKYHKLCPSLFKRSPFKFKFTHTVARQSYPINDPLEKFCGVLALQLLRDLSRISSLGIFHLERPFRNCKYRGAIQDFFFLWDIIYSPLCIMCIRIVNFVDFFKKRE